MKQIDISIFDKTVDKVITDKNEFSKIIISHCSEENKNEIQSKLKNDLKEEVENNLQSKFDEFLESFYKESFCGKKDFNEILYSFDFETRESILKDIKKYDEHMYDLVIEQMFSFECIKFLDDRDIQRLLRCTDDDLLVLALKDASYEVIEKFKKNIEKNHFANLTVDMEFMGPVKKGDIKKAQSEICQSLIKIYKDIGKKFSKDDDELYI